MIDADGWKSVEALFLELFEAPATQRRVTLEATKDSEVVAEVDALLRTHDELTGENVAFLGGLDADLAWNLIDSVEPVPSGTLLGRYQIIRPLGRGGMGLVYLARDPRLSRSVAIKLLPPHLSGNASAARSLGAEARAISGLDHPNIAVLHEIADTAEGQSFMVMQYYEGETVRERLASGPMGPDEAIGLAIQLADGLSAAHRAGVLHRDIKPENLIVTRDGVLRILDFGIAKALGNEPGSDGLIPGTAAYMSPEQSRGDPVDQRTDIWSAGVVIYEMLMGSRPFRGNGESLIESLRHEPPVQMEVAGVPSILTALVSRCLEKEPSARFQSADSLAAGLRAILADSPPHGLLQRASTSRILVAAVVTAVIGGLFFMRAGRDSPVTSSVAPAAPAVAILPFAVVSADTQISGEGMMDLITTNLGGVSGIRAIDSRTIMARWRRQTRDRREPELADAIAVARETGARDVVVGSIVTSGSELRISANVHSVADGSLLASFKSDGPADSIFSIVDRLSAEILKAVWQGLEQPGEEMDLARVTTSSLPAIKAYLNGERLLRQADWPGAIAGYKEAVEADSTFALALSHLGLAQVWLGSLVTGDEVWIESFRKAQEYSERLPDRERMLLEITYAVNTPTARDRGIILRLAQEATRQYPDDAEAWYLLGELYFHEGNQFLANWQESQAALEKAVDLDPGLVIPYVHLIQLRYFHSPDSAGIAQLTTAFKAVAPESRYVAASELASQLIYGDSIRQQEARSSLESLSRDQFADLMELITINPRYWDLSLYSYRERIRHSGREGVLAHLRLFNLSLYRGELDAARAYLGGMQIFKPGRSSGVYRMMRAGLLTRNDPLANLEIAPPEDTTVTSTEIFFAGALAADQSRWDDYTAALARLRSRSEWMRQLADSARARFTAGAATALEGYGNFRRGNTQLALRLLREGQVQTTWGASWSRNSVNDAIRWWLGDLHLATGHPEEAARYFASLPYDPFAAERLGPIYEEIGEYESARSAYELVIFAWQNGESPLRERTASARSALSRLDRPITGSQRQ